MTLLIIAGLLILGMLAVVAVIGGGAKDEDMHREMGTDAEERAENELRKNLTQAPSPINIVDTIQFESPEDIGYVGLENGMTLRDYFAAKAMAALITNGNDREKSETWVEFLPMLALSSYEIADAMITERDKEAE